MTTCADNRYHDSDREGWISHFRLP